MYYSSHSIEGLVSLNAHSMDSFSTWHLIHDFTTFKCQNSGVSHAQPLTINRVNTWHLIHDFTTFKCQNSGVSYAQPLTINRVNTWHLISDFTIFNCQNLVSSNQK